MSWLNNKLDNEIFRTKLKNQFQKNKPFPHLFVSDFLDERKAKDLAKAIRKEKFEEKDSDLFQFRQTSDLVSSKNKHIKDFYDYMASEEFSKIMEQVSGLKLNAGKIDMAGSLYISTDYLLCHDDELEDRKIAYIIYLCEDFEKEDGGAFCVIKDEKGRPGKTIRKYYPKFNSLLIFEVSKESWHEVEEVLGDKERYAIGGWLH